MLAVTIAGAQEDPCMIAILIGCFVCTTAPQTVVARVPKGPVQVSIDVEGYSEMPALSPNTILAGSISPPISMISVIALLAPVPRTSAQWREIRIPESRRSLESTLSKAPVSLSASADQPFELDGVACNERVVSSTTRPGADSEEPSFHQVNYHAFVTGARCCFEIHVSSTSSSGSSLISRGDLERTVRSFRIGLFRRGTFADFPREICAFMDEAARRMPDEAAWLDEQCRARPDELAVHFVHGELWFNQLRPGDSIRGHARAIEILEQKAKPTDQERFVHIVAEQGLGAGLLGLRRSDEALPHFKAAYDLAARSRRDQLAWAAHNLALAHAAREEAAETAKFLEEAIELDPAVRESARSNRIFDKVRGSKEIQALLDPPGGGR
jgi:hypothetical protein